MAVATLMNTNAVNTWYQAPVSNRQTCQVNEQPQDIYTPSSSMGSGLVSFKDMLALKAKPGSAAEPARGGQTRNPIAPDDFGVDSKGKAVEVKDLPKSPIHSSNAQMQNYLNFMYSTATGKAELDALHEEHPDAKVVVGGPANYKWGKDQGGVTIGDTIYINPKMVGNDPLDGAGLLAHEIWHAISPYKNSFAQEKTADDMRLAVTQELEKSHYGEGWSKAHGGVVLTKDNVDSVYLDTFSEYDGGGRPKAGDPAAEGAAAESRNIPVPSGIANRGQELYNRRFPKTTVSEVKE